VCGKTARTGLWGSRWETAGSTRIPATVEWFVRWGLEHRELVGVRVDFLSFGHGARCGAGSGPMMQVARTLRAHRELILNWFRARAEISAGAVEALNNKIRVVTRRSYGFRTYRAMELALYHNLGRLPEPPCTNRFC